MAGDLLYSSVGLLLHGDGTNGGTVITDSSSAPKTPTNTGVTTSTAQSKFGGSSLLFSATASRLVYAHNAAFQPTNDFCVESFVYIPAVTGAIRVLVWKGTSTGPYPYYIYIDASGKVQANSYGTSSTLISLLSPSALTANTWHHIAFDRSGSTFRLFINGTLVASGTAAGSLYSNTADPLVVGGVSDGTYGIGSGGAAYIDEFRITLASRYTSNFTVPTAPFGGAPYTLSGNVKNTAATNAARNIVVLREATGAVVGTATSDATTGNYSVATEMNDAHTIIAYPAAGESLPALVLSGVIPV